MHELGNLVQGFQTLQHLAYSLPHGSQSRSHFFSPYNALSAFLLACLLTKNNPREYLQGTSPNNLGPK